MRKETRVYNVYKFKELKKEIQDKVIEKLNDINTDYEWWEYMFKDWTAKLEKLGYNDVKIYFNGFSSQGDGACFTAQIDLLKWAKTHKLSAREIKAIDKGDITGRITHNYGYYFSTSTNVDINSSNDNDYINKTREKIEKMIVEEREELGDELYRELKKENDYLTSKEAIIETIEAYDYDFLEDGARF